MAQGVLSEVSKPKNRQPSTDKAIRWGALHSNRFWWLAGALSLILMLLFVVALAIGTVSIPAQDVLTILLGGDVERASWVSIIEKIRLPRAITAMIAGASLGAAGLLMQTFFRNPLAGPYILGISSGASLGVALVVLLAGGSGILSASLISGLGLAGDMALLVAAGLGSAIAMFMVLLIAQRVDNPITLLVLGLMFSYITGALVNLLVHFAIAEQIQAYISWTFGSFGSVTWSQLPILGLGVGIGGMIALLMGKSLNAFLLGETYARSMGVHIGRIRFWIIIATALLAGTVTAFCGPIGFVGIAVPHLARGATGSSDHRGLMPITMLMGAIVALIASIVAEVPGTAIALPLNAVTSLLGAPIVIGVILRQRNLRQAFN